MRNPLPEANMRKLFILISGCMVLGGVGISGAAQDFNLFEEVEASRNEQPAQLRPGRESRVTSAKPEFTLVGTSRIGDNYSVILADRDGEKIIIKTGQGVDASIPEYSGFQIVSTENGKVSLRHPESIPCVDYPDSGVRCNSAGNIAELTLPNNLPVRPPQNQTQVATTQVQEQAAEEIIEDPVNPFAIMRARAENGDPNNPAVEPAAGGNSRFIPRRIDPSEVPPGSRIVSTPFGDRLVPQ